MKKTLLILLIFALASQAKAEQKYSPNSMRELLLSVGDHVVLVRDRGYDFFSDKDTFSVGRVVGEAEVIDNLFAGLGLQAGGNADEVLWGISTKLKVVTPLLSVRYRVFGFKEMVFPYGRFAAGFSAVEVRLQDGWQASAQFTKSTVPWLHAALGAEFVLPRSVLYSGTPSRFTGGAFVEFGYTYSGSVSVAGLQGNETSVGSGDKQEELSLGSVSIGDLYLGGWSFGVGLNVYF